MNYATLTIDLTPTTVKVTTGTKILSTEHYFTPNPWGYYIYPAETDVEDAYDTLKDCMLASMERELHHLQARIDRLKSHVLTKETQYV
jgi:hypothetical protein